MKEIYWDIRSEIEYAMDAMGFKAFIRGVLSSEPLGPFPAVPEAIESALVVALKELE